MYFAGIVTTVPAPIPACSREGAQLRGGRCVHGAEAAGLCQKRKVASCKQTSQFAPQGTPIVRARIVHHQSTEASPRSHAATAWQRCSNRHSPSPSKATKIRADIYPPLRVMPWSQDSVPTSGQCTTTVTLPLTDRLGDLTECIQQLLTMQQHLLKSVTPTGDQAGTMHHAASKSAAVSEYPEVPSGINLRAVPPAQPCNAKEAEHHCAIVALMSVALSLPTDTKMHTSRCGVTYTACSVRCKGHLEESRRYQTRSGVTCFRHPEAAAYSNDAFSTCSTTRRAQ